MGRRRKHDGDLGLASDQIPGRTKTTSRIRPCHSLLYHHQAFRSDTPTDCTLLPGQKQAWNEFYPQRNLLHLEGA